MIRFVDTDSQMRLTAWANKTWEVFPSSGANGRMAAPEPFLCRICDTPIPVIMKPTTERVPATTRRGWKMALCHPCPNCRKPNEVPPAPESDGTAPEYQREREEPTFKTSIERRMLVAQQEMASRLQRVSRGQATLLWWAFLTPRDEQERARHRKLALFAVGSPATDRVTKWRRSAEPEHLTQDFRLPVLVSDAAHEAFQAADPVEYGVACGFNLREVGSLHEAAQADRALVRWLEKVAELAVKKRGGQRYRTLADGIRAGTESELTRALQAFGAELLAPDRQRPDEATLSLRQIASAVGLSDKTVKAQLAAAGLRTFVKASDKAHAFSVTLKTLRRYKPEFAARVLEAA